jgi:hypothetical protein
VVDCLKLARARTSDDRALLAVKPGAMAPARLLALYAAAASWGGARGTHNFLSTPIVRKLQQLHFVDALPCASTQPAVASPEVETTSGRGGCERFMLTEQACCEPSSKCAPAASPRCPTAGAHRHRRPDRLQQPVPARGGRHPGGHPRGQRRSPARPGAVRLLAGLGISRSKCVCSSRFARARDGRA